MRPRAGVFRMRCDNLVTSMQTTRSPLRYGPNLTRGHWLHAENGPASLVLKDAPAEDGPEDAEARQRLRSRCIG